MITLEEAKNKVYEVACQEWRNESYPEDRLIIIDSATIDKKEFWVFFYTSKLWYETNDMNYAIAGNAPIIVNKITGQLRVTGTAYGIEKYIKEYEEEIKNAL